MSEGAWETARLDDIQRLGKSWIPIRKHFGIAAFGVNAWVGQAEGDEIINEHVEESGHEELYLVTSGRATFTVAGEEIDAPAGSLVFVRDPETKRKAVAREPGTTIVTIGAKPGQAFSSSPIEVMSWETTAEMWPLYESGDYEGAAAILRESLQAKPDPGVYYNLACMEALLVHPDEAVEHLRRAIDEPRFRELAASDSDLESIRDDPRLAELLSPKS